MTKRQFHELGFGQYNFHTYYGIEKHGFLIELDNKYYIYSNTSSNRNIPIPEKGLQVELEQIDYWRPIDKDEENTKFHNQINESWIDPKNYDFNYQEDNFATKLIIVGAGASHNFAARPVNSFDNKLSPPLGKDLFSDLFEDILKGYKGAMNLSTEVLRTNDVEEYFENRWGQVQNNYDKHTLSRLINTQYYLHHLFSNLSVDLSNHRRNNYWSLASHANDYIVNRKHKEHILFVSFNYDTLLEEALSNTVSNPFDTIHDYVDFNRNKLLLFKPHGSCNWIKNFNPHPDFIASDVAETYSSSATLADTFYRSNISLSTINRFLSNDIKIFGKHHHRDDRPSLPAFYYPWLLIPYKNKDELVMPLKHTHVMDRFLSKIKDILIIGWKGNENVFLNKLKNILGSKDLNIYYANASDKSIEGRIDKYLTHAKITDVRDVIEGEPTFTNLMDYCANNPRFFFS